MEYEKCAYTVIKRFETQDNRMSFPSLPAAEKAKHKTKRSQRSFLDEPPLNLNNDSILHKQFDILSKDPAKRHASSKRIATFLLQIDQNLP